MTVEAVPPEPSFLVAAEISESARKYVRPGALPENLIESLVSDGLCQDALKILAHWLPKREAIWWGCQCIWHSVRPVPIPADNDALHATVRWVLAPGNRSRLAAEATSKATGPTSAAGYLARAAFYAGGSPPDVELPPALAAKTLVAAVLLAAAHHATGTAAEDSHRLFTRLGLMLAAGRNRWDQPG